MHLFSPGRNPFTDNFREVDDKVELVALPTAIYNAFRYKGMIKRRLFHPVLNLQSIDMTEMFHVTCYDNEVFLKCCGSNKHIHITYFLATLLKHPADFAILAKMCYRKLLKKVHQSHYILKMLSPFRLAGSKVKLSQSYIGNLTFINANFPHMLGNSMLTFDKGNACTCVKQIFPMCVHCSPDFDIS